MIEPRDQHGDQLAAPLDGRASANRDGLDATWLDADLSGGALRALADERVVHGLLCGMGKGARARIDSNVASAMAQLSVRPRRQPASERAHSAPGELRSTASRRLRSLIARALPALALVALILVLGQVSMPSQQAVADPLEQVVRDHVKAGDKAGPRRYAMLLERDTPQGPMPMRGLVDIAPGPGRKSDGTPGRGGRFLVRFPGPEHGPFGPKGERRARVAFGFDGERFWHMPEQGPVRVGTSKSVIEDGNQLRGLVSWLIVERALQQLQADGSGRRDGKLSGPPFTLETEDLEDGRRRHTLRRNPDARQGEGAWAAMRPSEVVFVAGANDRVVSELDAYWPEDATGRSRHPARIRHLRFELLRDQVPPREGSWFSHEAHHDGTRTVVEVEDAGGSPPGRGPGSSGRSMRSRGAER